MVLDVDLIVCIMYDLFCFGEVLVVVVDQVMLEMDGLDFCCQFDNLYIGKVLFIGCVDDEMVIEVFNFGLIDCFICKNDLCVMDKLQQVIVVLQQCYFECVGQFVFEVMVLGDVYFLCDLVFVLVLCDVLQEFFVVECYLYVNFIGLLLFDVDGDGWFLLIQIDDDLCIYYEIVSDLGVLLEVFIVLCDGIVLLWFGSCDGFYSDELGVLLVCMILVIMLCGEYWYYYVLVDDVVGWFGLEWVVSYCCWLCEQDDMLVW